MQDDNDWFNMLKSSPDRRVFTIDTGNLSEKEAELYVRDTVNKFRQKGFNIGDIGDDVYRTE